MKYKVIRSGRTHQVQCDVGEILYPSLCDYGCASDDTQTTGIEHVAVSFNESGGPFFTIPREDIEPI